VYARPRLRKKSYGHKPPVAAWSKPRPRCGVGDFGNAVPPVVAHLGTDDPRANCTRWVVLRVRVSTARGLGAGLTPCSPDEAGAPTAPRHPSRGKPDRRIPILLFGQSGRVGPDSLGAAAPSSSRLGAVVFPNAVCLDTVYPETGD
jgi:hypothetical protein